MPGPGVCLPSLAGIVITGVTGTTASVSVSGGGPCQVRGSSCCPLPARPATAVSCRLLPPPAQESRSPAAGPAVPRTPLAATPHPTN